ncbi:GtrA family protein [Halovulum sp. GXIMD14794]
MLQRVIGWIHRRPELVRVAITALINTVLAWITYEIVYALNGLDSRATTSWVIAFTIGIFRQHHLHRRLSFPNNRNSYLISLTREIWSSIWILAASAGLNYTLVSIFGFHHRTTWAVCLLTVAALDYTMMKLYVFRGRSGKRS